jgi:glycosyltransferase involved in cell wall biosynthesis
MKILQITYSFLPGGAERFTVDLANELSKNNEVHFLTVLDDKIEGRDFYKASLSQNITYHCAGEEPGFSLKKVINLYKIVKNLSPQIVHLNGAFLGIYLMLSIFFFRKPKYIETLHSNAHVRYTLRNLSFLSKFIYKHNLVKLITISGGNKKSFEDRCGIFNSTLIYNGRSTPGASIHIEDVKNEISSLKKSVDDKVFIHVGRCSDEKNQKMLITVFNKLAENGYGFILLIIGPNFDNSLGKSLQMMADSSRIFFMGPKTNVIDYFLCSDAFCLTSLHEGMPITLIEAFACGCIPISTPVSGAIDIIKDGEDGFITTDFSEDSYLNKVKVFFKDNKKIQKSELIKVYLENFSIEQCAEKYVRIYSDMLK